MTSNFETGIETYYEKYMPLVLRRCRKLLGNEDDALDAAQDVFVKVLKAKHRLHARYPSSLFYTIATNTCLNKLRQKRRHREVLSDEVDIPLHDTGYDEVDARVSMETIFKTESESTRTICFMYHVDGMTLKEVAGTVGMSISGVKKRLDGFASRARNFLTFF
jgi:RNA polymerase sigma-70 factor (ECF subfamily)